MDQSWDSVLVTHVLHVCSPQSGYKPASSSRFSASSKMGMPLFMSLHHLLHEYVCIISSFFYFSTAASTVPDPASPNIYVSGIAPLH